MSMAIHYVTVIATREKDARGSEVLRKVACIPGDAVPDMTVEAYYDDLANMLMPTILRALADATSIRKEQEIS